MKTFKGTQGEWTSNGLKIMCDGKPIGQAFLMSFKHDIRGKEIKDTEGVENAKLIAAAPELLEALQEIRTLLLHKDRTKYEPFEIEAAIKTTCNEAINKAL